MVLPVPPLPAARMCSGLLRPEGKLARGSCELLGKGSGVGLGLGLGLGLEVKPDKCPRGVRE